MNCLLELSEGSSPWIWQLNAGQGAFGTFPTTYATGQTEPKSKGGNRGTPKNTHERCQ